MAALGRDFDAIEERRPVRTPVVALVSVKPHLAMAKRTQRLAAGVDRHRRARHIGGIPVRQLDLHPFATADDAYRLQPHPDVIFLDLHLPKKSGLEVLAEIKGSGRLSVTPVVVVSGSENPNEIREAYELHASCYIRKPDDLHEFLRFIKICFEFWGSVVTLPPKPDLAGVPA